MKKILLFFTVAAWLAACNNNKSGSTGDQKVPAAGNSSKATISFKADGALVNTTGSIVQRFIWGDTFTKVWINITSNPNRDKRTINVNLYGENPGTYVFKEGNMMQNSHGSYYPDFSKVFDACFFKTGEFDLTVVDTVNNVLSGTFFGTCESSDGKKVIITEGKLDNVPLKPGVTDITAGFDEMLKEKEKKDKEKENE
jgi:hypothetical protein